MNTLERNYRLFRTQGGMDTKQAMRAARILTRWNELGEECVRMRAKEEEESYFASFGEPEAYTDIHGRRVSAEDARKEMERQLELHGCWRTISEYFDGEEWQHADSCGMHTGYKDVLSPFENWYVVDEMDAAIEAYEANAVSYAI